MDNLIQPNTLSPLQNFCCTIGNLPSSYMLSLSYEEQVLWLCGYLKNTVIPAINNNASALEEVQNLYLALKDYVDNYFDNLDVQEEINNKIDEMVEDGTLEQIINDSLFNKLSYYKITTSMTEQEIIDIINLTQPKVIEFEDGDYYFTSDIRFTSNTKFLFNNAVIHKEGKLFYSYYSNSIYTKYNGIRNVEFIGGKFTCSFILMHAKNITFNGCEFTEDNTGHAFQIASCRNIVIENCKFNGNIINNNNRTTTELIQIENCSHAGQPYAPEGSAIYDGTPNEFIYVRNCEFNNKDYPAHDMYSCIGTHSINYESESPFNKHVFIENNKFIGATYAPIHLMGFDDVHITNNYFENNTTCDYNILIRSYNSNIYIKDNIMRYGKGGIRINIHNNTYKLITNLQIINNKIYDLTGQANSSCIHLVYCNNVKILNNCLEKYGKYGIFVTNANLELESVNLEVFNNYFVQSTYNENAVSMNVDYVNNIRIIQNNINNANNKEALEFLENAKNVCIKDNIIFTPNKLLNNNYLPNSFARVYEIPILICDANNQSQITNGEFTNNDKNFNIQQFDTLLLNIGNTQERQWIEISSYLTPLGDLSHGETYCGTIVDRNGTVGSYKFKINDDGTFNYNGDLALRYIYGINRYSY